MARRYIDFDKITVDFLSGNNYCRDFDCSFEDDMGLNTFYHREAFNYLEEKLGITYVFLYEGVTLGFATLAMESVLRQQIDKDDQLDIHTKKYPAALIGRLAVDNNWRNLGLGTWIIKWCIGCVMSISDQIGCRYVVLQTNSRREGWYRKHPRNFKLLMQENNDYWLYKKIDLS
jgi:GNAT superfamily N-acetyltransferase